MSSALEMECPNCEKGLKVPPSVFGKKIKCRHCGHAFVVADPDEAPAAKPEKKGGKPGAKAAKPPAASPPPPPPPPSPKSRFAEDEDQGPAKIGVLIEDEIPRCPECAKALDPPNAIVCKECGFNNVTRAKAQTKRVWAPEAQDWFNHLAPGVVAVLIVIGLLVLNIVSIMNMRDWLSDTFLETDEKDATGKTIFLVKPGAFIFLIAGLSLVVVVPAVKFAYKRLAVDYHPPEQVKK